MKLSIEAPWGKDEFEEGDELGWIKRLIRQLEWFLQNGRSPNPDYTRQDLEGYRQVLATGSHLVAGRFIEIKGAAREKGKKYTNMEVIALMKANGEWHSKEKIN